MMCDAFGIDNVLYIAISIDVQSLRDCEIVRRFILYRPAIPSGLSKILIGIMRPYVRQDLFGRIQIDHQLVIIELHIVQVLQHQRITNHGFRQNSGKEKSHFLKLFREVEGQRIRKLEEQVDRGDMLYTEVP